MQFNIYAKYNYDDDVRDRDPEYDYDPKYYDREQEYGQVYDQKYDEAYDVDHEFNGQTISLEEKEHQNDAEIQELTVDNSPLQLIDQPILEEVTDQDVNPIQKQMNVRYDFEGPRRKTTYFVHTKEGLVLTDSQADISQEVDDQDYCLVHNEKV